MEVANMLRQDETPAAFLTMAQRSAASCQKMTTGGKNEIPRKRIVALAAFLACLTFVLFTLHGIISLLRDAMGNEKVLEAINSLSTNKTDHAKDSVG